MTTATAWKLASSVSKPAHPAISGWAPRKYEVLLPRHEQDSTTHDQFVTLDREDGVIVLRIESGNYDYDRRVDNEQKMTETAALYLRDALTDLLERV